MNWKGSAVALSTKLRLVTAVAVDWSLLKAVDRWKSQVKEVEGGWEQPMDQNLNPKYFLH